MGKGDEGDKLRSSRNIIFLATVRARSRPSLDGSRIINNDVYFSLSEGEMMSPELFILILS